MQRRLVFVVAIVGIACGAPSRAAAQTQDEAPPTTTAAEAPPGTPCCVAPETPPATYAETPPPATEQEAAQREAARRQAMQEHMPDFAFEITPYVWLPTALKDASTSVGGQAASVNADADDTFDDFRLSSGLRLEGWANHLGLVIDASWLHLARDVTTGGTAVDWYSNQFLGDFLGGVRLFTVRSDDASRSFSLALTGGVRVIYNRQNLRIDQVSTRGSDWFAKANLGGQIPIQLAEHFGLKAVGNVRLPDVGWTVMGIMRIQAVPFTLDLGYRWDHFNYNTTGNRLDVDAHSAYLGLGFRVDPRLFLD